MKYSIGADKRLKKTELLVILAIIFSFTGSSVIIMGFSFFSLTGMRMIGIICLIYALLSTINNYKTKMYNVILVIIAAIVIISTVVFSNNIRNFSLVIDILICIGVVRSLVFTIEQAEDPSGTLKRYVIAFEAGVIVTAIICIYEYITGNHVAANYTSAFEGDVYYYLLKAPTAFLYNPNNVGVLFVIAIPMLFFASSLYEEDHKLLLMILLITFFVVIFMTGSRGALVSAVIIIGISVIYSKLKMSTKFLVLVGAVVFVRVGAPFIMDQLSYGGMIRQGTIAIFNEGDGGRQIIWRSIIDKVFKEYPIFGAGAGGIERIVGMSAHNFLLEILGDYGIVGIVVFCLAYFRLFLNIIRYKNQREGRNDLLLLLVAVFLCMFIPPTMMTLHFVWISIAIAIASTQINSKRQVET